VNLCGKIVMINIHVYLHCQQPTKTSQGFARQVEFSRST